jgi:hypothetical protein
MSSESLCGKAEREPLIPRMGDEIEKLLDDLSLQADRLQSRLLPVMQPAIKGDTEEICKPGIGIPYMQRLDRIKSSIIKTRGIISSCLDRLEI